MNLFKKKFICIDADAVMCKFIIFSLKGRNVLLHFDEMIYEAHLNK